MKAGVRTTPRGMRISPVRARPSVLATAKVKRSVKRVYLSKRCPPLPNGRGAGVRARPRHRRRDGTQPAPPPTADPSPGPLRGLDLSHSGGGIVITDFLSHS